MIKLFILATILILLNCKISNDEEDIKIEEISDVKELSVFSLKAPKVNGNIKGDIITLVVPNDTDITDLIPIFEFDGARVEVNKIEQESGVSINDFTKFNIYTVIADDGSQKEYKIDIKFKNSLQGFKYSKSIFYFNQGQEIETIEPELSTKHVLTFSIKPELPKGLVFDKGSGVISGIPSGYCYDSIDYIITAKGYLDTVEAEITIREIIPIPPKITLSESMLTLKRNEVHTVQILNTGGPIEEITVEDSDWYEIDDEKLQLILRPNRRYPSFNYITPYSDLSGIKVTVSNSGGESSKYFCYTLEREKKVCTEPYLNVEEIFNEMYELDGDESIVETLYDVTNMEYRFPTLEWRYKAYLNYSFDGEVTRNIKRKTWLQNFPYFFRQTDNKVYVRRKSSNDEVEYIVDKYKSYSSRSTQRKLYIVRNDDSFDFPAFFQFRLQHYGGEKKINSLNDSFYISIPGNDNFTFRKKYNDIDFIESRPVVVTKGIQRLSEIKLEEEGYRGCGIWPASVSTGYVRTLYRLVKFYESSCEPEKYYYNHIEPLF